jgi:hypothetical protein
VLTLIRKRSGRSLLEILALITSARACIPSKITVQGSDWIYLLEVITQPAIRSFLFPGTPIILAAQEREIRRISV